ncbi:MAG: acetate--CoA ligase family protein [Burkholderiales bacterium]|nr:acetate--CoA ligase family protein [Burkholderiales bacterium]
MAEPRPPTRFQCNPMPGMAYGVGQPTVLVTAEVAPPAHADWPGVDAFLDGLLEEPIGGMYTNESPLHQLLARVVHLHGAMQRQQAVPVFSAGRVVSARPGRAVLALPCHEPQATTLVLDWAFRALDAWCAPQPPSPESLQQLKAGFDECLQALRAHAPEGLNSFQFLRAAYEEGIPVTRLVSDVWRYGMGAHSHWIKRSLTDRTPSIAVGVAGSKGATKKLLSEVGIPTPRHRRARDVEQALEVAQWLGYPVVVKPDDQEQGRGVFAGLRDAAAVREAFAAASAFSSRILVEKHHDGADYRLTVHEGCVVKILLRQPGGVTGDGQQTVAALVAGLQHTPRMQRVLRVRGIKLIDLDEEALGLLAEQGLAPDAVPAAGRFVTLRRKSNISAGGIQTLVNPGDCHPDNIDMVVRACRAVRLDLCGVDLLIPDIARSWHETGGVIIEMNAQPQIGANLGREAYAMVLRGLLGGRWNIPLHLAVCDRRKVPATPQALAALFPASACNGLALPRGVWVDGRHVAGTAANSLLAAGVLLADTSVTAAAAAMTVEDVTTLGLPASHFERIVFLRPSHLAEAERRLWLRARDMTQHHAADHDGS